MTEEEAKALPEEHWKWLAEQKVTLESVIQNQLLTSSERLAIAKKVFGSDDGIRPRFPRNGEAIEEFSLEVAIAQLAKHSETQGKPDRGKIISLIMDASSLRMKINLKGLSVKQVEEIAGQLQALFDNEIRGLINMIEEGFDEPGAMTCAKRQAVEKCYPMPVKEWQSIREVALKSRGGKDDKAD